jgi:hypothetical protein
MTSALSVRSDDPAYLDPPSFRRAVEETASRQADDRAGRQHLLDHVEDVLEWAIQVGGCPEYQVMLRTLLRAREDHQGVVTAAFVRAGTWPSRLKQQEPSKPVLRAVPRMSDVTWKLNPVHTTYEALLRLLFEEPNAMTAGTSTLMGA